jgi:hypothetical protein
MSDRTRPTTADYNAMREKWMTAELALSLEAQYIADLACNGELPDATTREHYEAAKRAQAAAAEAYFTFGDDQ